MIVPRVIATAALTATAAAGLTLIAAGGALVLVVLAIDPQVPR